MSESKEIALVLTGTLPEISGNFDACKAFYLSELARYDVIVDPERLPEAKKDLATLRAEAKRLDTIRIAEAKRLKQPITEMESKVKELTDLIGQAAEKIALQVKACEQKAVELCRSLMAAHLDATYDALEVAKDYRTGHSMIEQLAGVSKLAGKGELTKAARESIEGLAQQARIAQDRVELRLTRLKSASLEAGIQPITPESVTHLLNLDDAGFNAGLDRLIKAEVKRAEDAKAATIKAEQDRIRAEEAAKAKAEMERKMAEERAEREAKEKIEREARAAEEAKIRADAEEKRKAEEAARPAPVVSPKPVVFPKATEKKPEPAADKPRVYTIRVSAAGDSETIIDNLFAVLAPFSVESIEVEQ
jgi:hypothetical protein